MAEPQSAARKEAKSTGEVVSELWGLVKDYGRQETIDPLKHLKRFVIYGAAATTCFGLAGLMLVIAIMRVFQVEGRRWFSGNWSIVAYLVALVVTALAAALSVKQIKKKGKSS